MNLRVQEGNLDFWGSFDFPVKQHLLKKILSSLYFFNQNKRFINFLQLFEEKDFPFVPFLLKNLRVRNCSKILKNPSRFLIFPKWSWSDFFSLYFFSFSSWKKNWRKNLVRKWNRVVKNRHKKGVVFVDPDAQKIVTREKVVLSLENYKT